MRDTSPEAEAIQIEAFRRMSPMERVAMAFEASEWIMSIARLRVRTDAAAPPVTVRRGS
ncbi:MAG: hypothetical protein K2X99_00670 [Gemmatimonadaceae bacterium]|nr:hypothetical protein [Gemmatimonadaceae bacterium]